MNLRSYLLSQIHTFYPGVLLTFGTIVFSKCLKRLIFPKRVEGGPNKIQVYEQGHNCKVINIVHLNSPTSFFYSLFDSGKESSLDFSEAKRIVTKFREMKGDENVVLVINTLGGAVSSAEMIINAIRQHKGKVTAYVPSHAFSGGALIALACHEIVMDRYAVLGPVDPQVSFASFFSFPASSIVKAGNSENVGDMTAILKVESEKALTRIGGLVDQILENKDLEPDAKEHIKTHFATGIINHDQALTVEALLKLGLKINTDYPKELFNLFTY